MATLQEYAAAQTAYILEMWNSMDLSMRIVNVEADLSDAVLVAEFIAKFLSGSVDMRKYQHPNDQNDAQSKLENWQSLHRDVLSTLEIEFPPEIYAAAATAVPGVVQFITARLQVQLSRVLSHTPRVDHKEELISFSQHSIPKNDISPAINTVPSNKGPTLKNPLEEADKLVAAAEDESMMTEDRRRISEIRKAGYIPLQDVSASSLPDMTEQVEHLYATDAGLNQPDRKKVGSNRDAEKGDVDSEFEWFFVENDKKQNVPAAETKTRDQSRVKGNNGNPRAESKRKSTASERTSVIKKVAPAEEPVKRRSIKPTKKKSGATVTASPVDPNVYLLEVMTKRVDEICTDTIQVLRSQKNALHSVLEDVRKLIAKQGSIRKGGRQASTRDPLRADEDRKYGTFESEDFSAADAPKPRVTEPATVTFNTEARSPLSKVLERLNERGKLLNAGVPLEQINGQAGITNPVPLRVHIPLTDDEQASFEENRKSRVKSATNMKRPGRSTTQKKNSTVSAGAPRPRSAPIQAFKAVKPVPSRHRPAVVHVYNSTASSRIKSRPPIRSAWNSDSKIEKQAEKKKRPAQRPPSPTVIRVFRDLKLSV